jgi:hypothetical protein
MGVQILYWEVGVLAVLRPILCLRRMGPEELCVKFRDLWVSQMDVSVAVCLVGAVVAAQVMVMLGVVVLEEAQVTCEMRCKYSVSRLHGRMVGRGCQIVNSWALTIQ